MIRLSRTTSSILRDVAVQVVLALIPAFWLTPTNFKVTNNSTKGSKNPPCCRLWMTFFQCHQRPIMTTLSVQSLMTSPASSSLNYLHRLNTNRTRCSSSSSPWWDSPSLRIISKRTRPTLQQRPCVAKMKHSRLSCSNSCSRRDPSSRNRWAASSTLVNSMSSQLPI